MDTKFNHFKILDEILKVLYNNQSKSFTSEELFKEVQDFKSKTPFDIYLNKLSEYVNIFHDSCKDTDLEYSLNLDGVIFYESGGFLQEHKSNKSKKLFNKATIAATIINSILILILMYLSIFK